MTSEGKVTEPNYLRILANQISGKAIQTVMTGSNSVKSMREKIEEVKRERGKSSEIWIVIDLDRRTDSEMSQIYKLAASNRNVHVALSSPCFEFWLLLHFRDGKDVRESVDPRSASAMCLQNLKNVDGWGDYDKSLMGRSITREDILNAVRRAREYDETDGTTWSRRQGTTTFYRLVESYLGIKS